MTKGESILKKEFSQISIWPYDVFKKQILSAMKEIAEDAFYEGFKKGYDTNNPSTSLLKDETNKYIQNTFTTQLDNNTQP